MVDCFAIFLTMSEECFFMYLKGVLYLYFCELPVHIFAHFALRFLTLVFQCLVNFFVY